jgi:hypothetical protein
MVIKGLAAATTGAVLLSCGTAPVVTARNYKTGVFIVCGGRNSSREDLSKHAAKACTTPPKLLRCTADVNYPTVGIEGEVTVNGNCCDYECPPESSIQIAQSAASPVRSAM